MNTTSMDTGEFGKPNDLFPNQNSTVNPGTKVGLNSKRKSQLQENSFPKVKEPVSQKFV